MYSPQLEPLFPLPAPAPVAAFFNPRTEAESWFVDSLEAWCKARGRTGMNRHFGQSRSLHYSSSVAKTYFSNKPQSPFNLSREDALDLVPGHTGVPFSLTLSLNKLSHFPIIFRPARNRFAGPQHWRKYCCSFRGALSAENQAG